MLLEEKLDRMDAQHAAIYHHFSFKQRLVKALASVGITVDKKSTFSSSDLYRKTNIRNRLYGDDGRVTNSSKYSRKDRYINDIEIILHKTSGINSSGDYVPIRINLIPDTLGYVNVTIRRSEDSPSKTIKIADKTVSEFEKLFAKTVRFILKTEPKTEKVEFEEIKNSFVDKVQKVLKDFNVFKVEPQRSYSYKNYPLTIQVDIEYELPEKVNNEIRSTRELDSFLYDMFNENRSVKQAYKKATGESAGKKNDDWNIAHRYFRGNSKELETYILYERLFDTMKFITKKVSNVEKSQNIFILKEISLKNMWSDKHLEFDFIIRKNGVTRERERVDNTSLNVYEWLKSIKERYNSNELKKYQNKSRNEIMLPVARQLIKQFFKVEDD